MTKTETKNILKILYSIHGVFLNPDTHTKNGYAKTSSGTLCSTHDPDACKFCLVGAIDVSIATLMPNLLGMDRAIEYKTLALLHSQKLQFTTIFGFNDAKTTSSNDVLNVIEKTIVQLES